MMTPAAYQAKATTAATAWGQVFGRAPSLNALTLVMAVADLETGLGNVPGHNWGFLHKGVPSPAEAALLAGAGLTPTSANLPAAQALLSPTQTADEVLTIDSGTSGPYFVWIWAFPSDLQAAVKFVNVLVAQRPSVASILDTASPADLAAAMYATGYFTGVSADAQTNVNAYAALIASHASAIGSALATWTPPAAIPVLTLPVTTITGSPSALSSSGPPSSSRGRGGGDLLMLAIVAALVWMHGQGRV